MCDGWTETEGDRQRDGRVWVGGDREHFRVEVDTVVERGK